MATFVLGMTLSCQAAFTRGPYLSFADDPAHSMVVSWGTQSLQTGVVWYGTSIPYSMLVNEITPDTIHHVQLPGLSVNTHYFYRVFSGSDSATGDFWTAPLPTDPIEIIGYGDSQYFPIIHSRIVQQFMQYSPRLILKAGDSAVNGTYGEFNYLFFGPTQNAICHVPLISCPGNHDADSGTTWLTFTYNMYKRLFEFPGNELYFSFDFGPVHFTILNSQVAWQYGPETPQTQWLMADLAATEQPYRIVMFHTPPYTSGSGNPSNMSLRQYWCPIFGQHHVQMVINGHQHFYQRCEPGDGIVYVITGGAGSGLYNPTFDSSYVRAAYPTYHFLRLQIQPDSIVVTAIDTSNTVLDRFTLFPWRLPVPAPILNLTIHRETGGIRLNWGTIRQDTSGFPLTITQYRIYRNTLTPSFLPDSTNYLNATADSTFRDTSISPQTTHAFYQVTAIAPMTQRTR